jgi:ribosomal protein L11 methyltransferase
MTQQLQHLIHKTILDANRKLTPGEVEVSVARETDADRKTVRRAIKDLLNQGDLAYSYVYGTSYLEPSFDRPVKLSKRIVIKPPQKAYQPRPGEVVVNMVGETAFGNGAHPSTCLALRALDDALADDGGLKKGNPLTGLDVGTGTGILAIAMVKLGVQQVVGLDIDACAISEATRNVQLNGLASQIAISNTPLEELKTRFSFVAANLAYPTLKGLAALMKERMDEDGMLILSGFKEPASRELSEAYAVHGFRTARHETERGWVCLSLRKRLRGCS